MALQIPYTNEELLRVLALAYGHSNVNLLDNWYFPAAVNQRGEETYGNSAGGRTYGIDRWCLDEYPGTMTLQNGLLFSNVEGEAALLRQKLVPEGEYPAAYGGKTVTFSLLSSGELVSGTVTLPAEFSADTECGAAYFAGKKSLIRLAMRDGWFGYEVYLSPEDGACSHLLNAAKLELGTLQTLAYQDGDGGWQLLDAPPAPAMELVKCQRYLRVFRNRTGYSVDFPAVITSSASMISVNMRLEGMRTIPTVRFSGGFIVRNADGYLSEASYSSPYAEPVLSFSAAPNITEAVLLVAKADGSVWSADNNTTCMLGLSKGSMLLFSAEE